jgi:hypothetical protein
VVFNGARDDTFPRFFHEFVKEDKGKEFTFKGFKSILPINGEDVEVNPLHLIFNLKGVLVGKEYF